MAKIMPKAPRVEPHDLHVSDVSRESAPKNIEGANMDTLKEIKDNLDNHYAQDEMMSKPILIFDTHI